ncbi:uncharacterized protein ARMOST_02613 [Armillaria ostoyae]|uniref:Ricin B lectin domain-containing protein n=1 Tax=Armillaria ostoyae TaxID=47428 RepID=A0A284QS72_ARMOS|nr:uncharacterized protein ARMOST_02613 [Armillaria ostoyae]
MSSPMIFFLFALSFTAATVSPLAARSGYPPVTPTVPVSPVTTSCPPTVPVPRVPQIVLPQSWFPHSRLTSKAAATPTSQALLSRAAHSPDQPSPSSAIPSALVLRPPSSSSSRPGSLSTVENNNFALEVKGGAPLIGSNPYVLVIVFYIFLTYPHMQDPELGKIASGCRISSDTNKQCVTSKTNPMTLAACDGSGDQLFDITAVAV